MVGTLDTKGTELRFIRDLIVASGLRTRLVDVSTSGKLATCDVTAQEIALNHGRGGAAVFGRERGASVAAMAEAFEAWIKRQNDIAGIISAGGSGGASIVAPGMRALPIGAPKVLVSSIASGDVGRYVGPTDITMMYSVTDVQGLNAISRQVLANGAQALIGMVKARLSAREETGAGRVAPDRPSLGRADHVRRHHALRAADHGGAGRGLGVPRLSRHRRRRPLHGEAGRIRASSRRSSTSPPPRSPTC